MILKRNFGRTWFGKLHGYAHFLKLTFSCMKIIYCACTYLVKFCLLASALYAVHHFTAQYCIDPQQY